MEELAEGMSEEGSGVFWSEGVWGVASPPLAEDDCMQPVRWLLVSQGVFNESEALGPEGLGVSTYKEM